jgi:hypothetical protein
LLIVDFLYLPPLSPSQTDIFEILVFSYVLRGGRDFERGRSPLSLKLPSPAINICGLLPVPLAGEGWG